MIKKIVFGLLIIATVYLSWILVIRFDKPPQPIQQDIIEKLYLEKSKNIIEKKTIMVQKQIVDKRLQELNTAIEEIDGKIKTEINSGLDFQ